MSGGRQNDLFQDCVERVCTSYYLLRDSHATSYREKLITVLTEAQLTGEYVGEYFTCIAEELYSLRIKESTSDETRVDRPSSPNEGKIGII